MESLVEFFPAIFSEYGLFTMLFAFLFWYTLKKNEENEQRYIARENKYLAREAEGNKREIEYQNLLRELSERFKTFDKMQTTQDNIECDVKEIKAKVYEQ